MLDQLVERVRDQKVISREDSRTEDRVKVAFLYHLDLLYRNVGEFLGHSLQAVHERYIVLADPFEPEPDEHGKMIADETKVAVEYREVFVLAALDRHTHEMIHVEDSSVRTDLNALLFLRSGLESYRGRPVTLVDRCP